MIRMVDSTAFKQSRASIRISAIFHIIMFNAIIIQMYWHGMAIYIVTLVYHTQ